MAGYKPPPSVKTQLPDATIGDLPRMSGGTVTPGAPVAPAAAPVAPAAGAVTAPLTKQQQMLKMMQDAAAALDARDAVLKLYMDTKMTTPGDEPPMTVKAPGGSGVPTE